MSRLQELHPDQQAVLQLVLRRRMAYADIGATLGLEPAQVRERALDAVDGLAPDDVEGLALEDRDRIADLLLGQGPDDERATTRALLRDHAPARTWATRVAGELGPLGGAAEALPASDDAPGAAAPTGATAASRAGAGDPEHAEPGTAPAGDEPAAAPPPDDPQARAAAAAAAAAPVAAGGSGDVREAFAALDGGRTPKARGQRTPKARGARTPKTGGSRRSGGSRPSGRLLAGGALALVVAALVIAWVGGVFDRDGGESASTAAPAPTGTSTAESGVAQDAAAAQAFLATLPRQINFTAPVGAPEAFANAKAIAQSALSQTTGEPVLLLTTEGVPKATSKRRYYAWADKSGADPLLIGELADARGAELPFVGFDVKTRQPTRVDPTVYNRIRITRQPDKPPTKPGSTMLVGTLKVRSGT
ncbi:hypothetical protein [Patulibacter americanus]|uniref:hypothetical protein n=1 Tax=Patulibacter americanus TaxID=588672 RepID=UPI0003B77AD0|nr:hypothetical protein [Patulibacter americanus]